MNMPERGQRNDDYGLERYDFSKEMKFTHNATISGHHVSKSTTTVLEVSKIFRNCARRKTSFFI